MKQEMKTPLQEFIEVLKIHRDTAFTKADENEGKQNHYYCIVRGDALTDAISFAEALLEKEKEIICNAFSDAQHGAVESRWTAEEYFEETFNTKEK